MPFGGTKVNQARSRRSVIPYLGLLKTSPLDMGYMSHVQMTMQ